MFCYSFGDIVAKLSLAMLVGLSCFGVLLPGISLAQGVGYDAGVYGQSQGQVMHQGSAVRMRVLNVRPVRIEVAQSNRSANHQQMGNYAVVAAGTGVGAILGNQLGRNTSTRSVGAILGGLAGAMAGNAANGAMNNGGQYGLAEGGQVSGLELTLINPANQQVSVVTQAGSEPFAEDDPVLVISTNGSTRVVADRSQGRY